MISKLAELQAKVDSLSTEVDELLVTEGVRRIMLVSQHKRFD